MKKVIKKAVAKAPVKKTVAKKPMMKIGGAKKPLRKAQLGENFQGPVTKKTNEMVNKEYSKYTGPRVYDQDVKDADELKRLRENYDRIPKEVFDEYKKGGSVKKTVKRGMVKKATAKKIMVKSKKK